MNDPRWINTSPGRCICQPCGLEIARRGKAAHKRACFGWQPAHHPDGDAYRDPDAERSSRTTRRIDE